MSAAAIKLALLMLALTPSLIYNMRTGNVRNRYVAALLATGLIVAFLGPYLGSASPTLWTVVGWVLAALFLFGVGFFGIPGGISKFLMALLPWFPLTHYLIVVAIGIALMFVIWRITKRESVPIVPPMMAASLVVGLVSILFATPL